MTKTKSRILTALALTTALTAPALIAPMFNAPAAIAAPQVVQDFSDLAAKVTPAVVNVAVTMKAGSDDGDDVRMSGQQDKQMEEFMKRFAERFGQPAQPGKPQGKQRPADKGQAVGTVFIALATKLGPTTVEQHRFPTDRETFKDLTAQTALDLLRRRLG